MEETDHTNPSRVPDRRRRGEALSPKESLEQMPALLVLERLPHCILAVAFDGTVVFANTAISELLGYPTETLHSLAFHQIFHDSSADSPVEFMRTRADQIVELVHCDGWHVRAIMSTSALRRDDDPVALVMLHDITEELWLEQHRS